MLKRRQAAYVAHFYQFYAQMADVFASGDAEEGAESKRARIDNSDAYVLVHALHLSRTLLELPSV